MDAEIASRLQEALGERYRVERELGRGGMATVYLAEDTTHERMVAVKVLQPELAAAVGSKRFRREIAIAGQLQHPHILPLLESGESGGGLFWFSMPYVEGQSLRARLTRQHQLPLSDALRIAREIASALDYAHRRGVIHRDVKPENILLSSKGEALLSDFGIARDVLSAGIDALAGEARLTDTGVSLGTLEYMSPEQTAGTSDVDGRTDVYALGCVLYEMLAGEPPFTGASPQALVARRLVERPLPLSAVRDRIPQAVEEAVEIALARSPADRYQHAGEFAAALDVASATPAPRGEILRREPSPPARRPLAGARRRSWHVGVALILLTACGAIFAWSRWRPRPSAAAPLELAVLPFEEIGDTTNPYLATGVADQVRTKLAALPALRVIARASSMQYRHATKSPQVIADELGVQHLVTGQIRLERAPEGTSHVHVLVALLRVSGHSRPKTEWQSVFDGELADIFQLQARLASGVATALDVPLGPGQHQELSDQPTTNLEAYDAYLQGEALRGDNSPPTLHRRAEFYSRAVSADSDFGLAWAELSYMHSAIYYYATPTVDEATAAAYAISRAQALSPGRPETQMALSYYENGVRRDPPAARAAAEAGLSTAPNNVDLLTAAAAAERTTGLWDLALEHARRAVLLDPRSPTAAASYGTTLHYLRRYQLAHTAYDRTLALAPRSLGVTELQAMVSVAQGDTAGARAVIRRRLSVADTSALLIFLGQENSMYWILDEDLQQRLLRLAPDGFDDHGSWGLVRAELYWLRGDTVRARVYADTARRVFGQEVKAGANDELQDIALGLADAFLGDKTQAVKLGEEGVARRPLSGDHVGALFDQQLLAQIYTVTGERDKAIDRLEALLQVPSFLSPAFLRVDPIWAPLRGNPRFAALTREAPQ